MVITVATPKQIREVMQVDGLTNDEVKSHLQVSNSLALCKILMLNNSIYASCLKSNSDHIHVPFQKYRLHNRRSPGAAPVTQQIVLMGGLCVPKEQSSSQSGSPQGPLQFSGSGSGVVASAATVGGDSSSSGGEDDKSESYSRK
jgi:hypothetical protein